MSYSPKDVEDMRKEWAKNYLYLEYADKFKEACNEAKDEPWVGEALELMKMLHDKKDTEIKDIEAKLKEIAKARVGKDNFDKIFDADSLKALQFAAQFAPNSDAFNSLLKVANNYVDQQEKLGVDKKDQIKKLNENLGNDIIHAEYNQIIRNWEVIKNSLDNTSPAKLAIENYLNLARGEMAGYSMFQNQKHPECKVCAALDDVMNIVVISKKDASRLKEIDSLDDTRIKMLHDMGYDNVLKSFVVYGKLKEDQIDAAVKKEVKPSRRNLSFSQMIKSGLTRAKNYLKELPTKMKNYMKESIKYFSLKGLLLDYDYNPHNKAYQAKADAAKAAKSAAKGKSSSRSAGPTHTA